MVTRTSVRLLRDVLQRRSAAQERQLQRRGVGEQDEKRGRSTQLLPPAFPRINNGCLMRRKLPPPPPPTASLAELDLYEWSVKADRDLWLQPQFKDLLHDAEYFAEAAAVQSDSTLRARYARAAIVFGAAAVEASSTDALVAVADLLGDSW